MQSSSKRYGTILLASTIQGAAIAFALWMFGNQWKVNGAGWPERLGWPWSNAYLVVLGGALVGAFAGFVRSRFTLAQSQGVEEAARSMGLAFQPEVARTELGETGDFHFFEKWQSGSNRVTGHVEGLPVEMLDYVYVEKGSEQDTKYAQTIVILPAERSLPVLELRPRQGWLRILGAVGMTGVTFDSAQAPAEDARSVQEFCERYFLSRGIDVEVAENAESLADGETPSEAERYGPIRKLFSAELLRFFAATPGWCVDSNGKRLAIWRANTLIPGRDRKMFVTTALEVRQAIVRSAESKTGVTVPARPPGVRDIAAIQGRLLGAVIGGFAGIFAAPVLTGLLSSRLGALTPVVFFGTPVLGPVVGWFVGGLALTPALAAHNRRKRTLQAQALAESPWRQPLESTAVVDEEADRLTIRFPAGLIQGGGCALVAGCVMAILFMTVFSAVWVPAALRGEVHWGENEGPPNPGKLPVKMSPWAALLFLVPFWLAILAASTALAYRARRRALLQVDADGLRLEEVTLFGTQQRTWQHDELVHVQAAEDDPGKAPRKRSLAIVTLNGEVSYWLRWRNRTEVKWLAELVRQRLGFSDDAETPSPA